MGFKEYPFKSISSWAPGDTLITSYAIEELLGTKMRALYQRRKGRDLYDLYVALTTLDNLDIQAIIHCFHEYTSHQSQRISKKNFLMNMDSKLKNDTFLNDIAQLLPYNAQFDPIAAYTIVKERLLEAL
jgi:predicted nucleotidyltransferase component of viral defense system